MILAAKSGPNLSMIVDTLLNYEADPLMTDNDGLNAIDYAADQETKDMLKRFVDESKHRSGYHTSDNHSFDDDLDTAAANANPDYSVPFGMQDDDQPIFVVEQVPVEDLSSWESSQDEDLHSNPNQTLKPSPGMMDLSKFLTPSDDENEEKLYDTVENVRQQVERIKDDPKILPDTVDSEPESWDDDDSPPLPDDDEDHEHHQQVHRSESTAITTPSDQQPPLTSSAREESVGPAAVESLAENLFPRKSPALIEQPSSLDLRDSANTSSKRRGSRKSRSLRSTHLAMMSRPLVTSIIPVDPDHPMLDKSSSSELSSGGEISE